MMRPNTKAPELKIKSLPDNEWNLDANKPDKYTMVVFYRGLHCPVCKTYLQSLSTVLDDFKEQGVDRVIAVSGDTKDKAMEAKEKWNLTDLEIGYDQTPAQMKDWGLFISTSIKDSEPEYFGEPGLFLIDKEGKIFYCATNSMPFARPTFEDLLKGLKFINKEGYPSRGRVSYEDIES